MFCSNSNDKHPPLIKWLSRWMTLQFLKSTADVNIKLIKFINKLNVLIRKTFTVKGLVTNSGSFIESQLKQRLYTAYHCT